MAAVKTFQHFEYYWNLWRWATAWTIWVVGLDSRLWLGIFLFTTASRTAPEPTQQHLYLYLYLTGFFVCCFNWKRVAV